MTVSPSDVTPPRSIALGRVVPAARQELAVFGSAELGLMGLSFALLVLTCVDAHPIRELAVIVWLVSFTMLAVRNPGAAFGLYISALALYANLRFTGSISLFERPDHPALLIFLGSLAVLHSKGGTRTSFDRLTLALVAFLAYGVANGFLTGTISKHTLSAFARAFGIPMVFLLLFISSDSRLKDLWSFFIVMFGLAFYSAVVSIAWQVEDLHPFIFPSWLTDPTVSHWAASIRSGGLLIQPGWNGLLLGMIFCMVYLAYHRWVFGHARLLLLILGSGILVAIYFTYSRAAYLGALAAVTGLLWMRTGRDRNLVARRLVLVMAAVMGLALAFVMSPSTLEDRVSNESTAEWRLEIWDIALNMIPSRPLFGFGFRGYSENAYKYLDNPGRLTRGGLEESEPSVHNVFLDVMVELGLVGFALYAMLHLLIFLRASQRADERWGRQGRVWVLVFMAVYFIKGQFGVTQEPTTNAIFYGTLGLLAGLPIHNETAKRLPAH